MICAGIIGATGYVGTELLRLLLGHPNIKTIFLSSVSFEGRQIENVYPNFLGVLGNKCDGVLITADEVLERSDIIFTALPHGLAEQYAERCLKTDKKLIDLSADFRFTDEAVFAKWYKKTWAFPNVHAQAVYGLPEMNRLAIQKASIIGNPGCYVTAATLAVLPAVKAACIKTSPIIADCKSGITGAGRNPSLSNSFSECGESCSAYGIGEHRHQPEISANLSKTGGKQYTVVFTPHLLPMSRGIIATLYSPLKKAGDPSLLAQNIHKLYTDFYKNAAFVRVLPLGESPKTKNVRGTNYCDISVHIVQDGSMLETVSVLDNMMKGASGQAVQNMNLICGFSERAGLELIPAAF